MPLSVVVPEPMLLRLPRVLILPRFTPPLKFSVNASLAPLNTAGAMVPFKVVPLSATNAALINTVPL